MDISEEEVDTDSATGSKESSVGENSLDSIQSEEHDDDSASGSSDGEMILDLLLDDMSDDLTDQLDDIIAPRIPSLRALQTSNNQLLERSDYKYTVFHAMTALNNLTGVRMWSPLYLASMRHIQADVTHREAFFAFPDPEDKICFLEYRTGKKRDE
ncbi:hypothetical protein CARUB_v10014823mg [Capsella rubella]|uniref:Uncharacterized protein n=1 Tax=Capsella rubella TaxID=81985 RepID=R0I170_9BRAS|nr:UPF0725 protein At2g20625 [Capsella rubella]EOA31625.1 hypothetical protein CARUB_v10014823mg [Capsella rubella]